METIEEFSDLWILGATRVELGVVDLLTNCNEETLEVVKLRAANEELASLLTNGVLEVRKVKAGGTESVTKPAALDEDLSTVELLVNGVPVVLLAIVEEAPEGTEVEVAGEVPGARKLESANDELRTVTLLTSAALVVAKLGVVDEVSELTELDMTVGTLKILAVLVSDEERTVALLLKNDALDVAKLEVFVASEGVILGTIDETLEVFVLLAISEALVTVELSDDALELVRLEEIDEASEKAILDRDDGSLEALKLIDVNAELATVELLTNGALDLVKPAEADEVLEFAKPELLDEASEVRELGVADGMVETVEL